MVMSQKMKPIFYRTNYCSLCSVVLSAPGYFHLLLIAFPIYSICFFLCVHFLSIPLSSISVSYNIKTSTNLSKVHSNVSCDALILFFEISKSDLFFTFPSFSCQTFPFIGCPLSKCPCTQTVWVCYESCRT